VTDHVRDASVDRVLRRLDVAATPDEAFVRASAEALRLRAARATSQDGSLPGRVRRHLRSIGTWPVPIRRTPALALVVLIVSLLLLGLLLALAGSRPRVPAPFGVADNGRVAFVKGDHIFTSDPLGRDVRQMTFGEGAQTDPRYSADGTRLVYRQWNSASPGSEQGTYDAVVVAADGTNPIVVASGIVGMSHVSWSPGGDALAFSGSPDGGPTSVLYVAAADGSAGPRVVDTVGGSAWDPTWAPDDKRLVVASDVGLWVVDRDGSNRRLVTHNRYKEIGSRGEAAEWSPDGEQIVFTAVTQTDQQDVYLVSLDGSAEHRVSGDVSTARDATYSPDGTRIAYMRTGAGLGPLCYIADTEGQTVRILPGAYGWYQPVWSPDGKKVVLTDDRPGPANEETLPTVRVIVDVAGSALPIEIPAPGTTPEMVPDWAASWQRVLP
jgi:Tol biopolymer transport system component